MHVLALLVFVTVALIVLGLVEAATIDCTRDTNSHCLITPPNADRFNTSAPTFELKTGRLLASAADRAGAYTFSVTDGTVGTATVLCKDGGIHFYDVEFEHTNSTVLHAPDSTGAVGSISFSDNINAKAGVGQTIHSGTPGVDAIVSCRR